jgi:hypothetical protein
MSHNLQGLESLLHQNAEFRKVLDKHTTLNFATGKRTPNPLPLPEPPKSKAQQLFQGQDNPKKQNVKKKVRLEQWVEITIEDGVVKTELFPSNEVLIKEGQAKWPPPEIIYRRLNFVDGIPDNYAWAGINDENHRKWGGCGLQRMTVDTWLGVIEEEARRGDGHLIGVVNLPRPRDMGECLCESCQRGYLIEDGALDPGEFFTKMASAGTQP